MGAMSTVPVPASAKFFNASSLFSSTSRLRREISNVLFSFPCGPCNISNSNNNNYNSNSNNMRVTPKVMHDIFLKISIFILDLYYLI
jgi:hypothetical protein